jgi:hypothetical protein
LSKSKRNNQNHTKANVCSKLGEGSGFRPFQIGGSCHEASRLRGGAGNLEASKARPHVNKCLIFCFIFSLRKELPKSGRPS